LGDAARFQLYCELGMTGVDYALRGKRGQLEER
jgi:hypothetical protein